MKIQSNSLVTLAILYGTALAVPVPNNAMTDDRIPDSFLSYFGKLLGAAFSGAVPNSVLEGAAQGANAHFNSNSYNSRDVAEAEDSISDSILNAIGKVIGAGFSGIVPESTLEGAAQGAGAHLDRSSSLPRDMAENNDTPSEIVGELLAELLALAGPGRAIAPSSASQTQSATAPASTISPVSARDEAEADDSISDAFLNALGKFLGAGFSGLVPDSTLEGAAQGAGAHLNRNRVLPRNVAMADDDVPDAVLNLFGKLIGAAWSGFVPSSTLQGSAEGAGAVINN